MKTLSLKLNPHLLISALLLSGAFLVGSTAALAESSSDDRVKSEKTHQHDNQSNSDKKQGVEDARGNKKEHEELYDSSKTAPKYDPSVQPGKIEKKDLRDPGQASPSSTPAEIIPPIK